MNPEILRWLMIAPMIAGVIVIGLLIMVMLDRIFRTALSLKKKKEE